MTFWLHLHPVVAEDARPLAPPRALGQGRQGGSTGKLDCCDCRTSAGGPGKDRFVREPAGRLSVLRGSTHLRRHGLFST